MKDASDEEIGYEEIGDSMRPGSLDRSPRLRVIAHHTSAARMAKVKLDIPGKKNEPSVLEAFG
jgi:hypothetical protein